MTQKIPANTQNFYDLRGEKLNVSYSTTSINGKPRFTYQDASRALSFSGDEIRKVETEIGTLITVTLYQMPDATSTTFTLLIPRVSLELQQSVSISAEGITASHRGMPGPRVGQRDYYTVTELRGTAGVLAS
ncbi:MAG TPA: hypothetical protein VL242_36635 [Sorangium sp.]|nr:hypothetical protein [Sorangium sp.]